MTKLPVGKTVVAAYSFAFSNLGAIIGLIWIPMLAVTVIGFFARSTYIDAMISYQVTKNATDLGPGFMWMILFVFVALLGNAMMLVPVLQQALGKRKDHVMAHFALGAPEWRMFGAYLTLLGVVIACALFAAVIETAVMSSIATAAKGVANDPAVAAGLGLVLFLILIAFLAIFVRLAFFIPAVTLLEEKVDLRRGWALGQGNTLRIAAVVLMIALPVVLLYLGIEVALFGPDAVIPQLNNQGPPSIGEMQQMRARMPITEALGFFLAPLTVGLNAGAVVAAYRVLVSPANTVETLPQ